MAKYPPVSQHHGKLEDVIRASRLRHEEHEEHECKESKAHEKAEHKKKHKLTLNDIENSQKGLTINDIKRARSGKRPF